MDLRKEYLGLKLSHTAVMRLVSEQVKPAKILEVGTRSVCREELAYARKAEIDVVPSLEIRKLGVSQTATVLEKKLAGYENIYLSMEMDILDPRMRLRPRIRNPTGSVQASFSTLYAPYAISVLWVLML